MSLPHSASSNNFRTIPTPQGESFSDNTVTNSKYTMWNFLPKNFWFQFHMPINIYFLVITLLQFIPIIAPVSPLTSLIPLAFAFTLTAVKEGFDDYHRHVLDAQINNRVYEIVVQRRNVNHQKRGGRDSGEGERVGEIGSVVEVKSQSIEVGDLVLLQEGQEVPADIIPLLSADLRDGVAYCSTENLDGEINGKPKICVFNDMLRHPNSPLAPRKTRNTFKEEEFLKMEEEKPDDENIEDIASELTKNSMFSSFSVSCDHPSPNLRKFTGTMELSGEDGMTNKISCSIDNLILATSVIRATKFVFGFVVYTGNETRVGMNKRIPPSKWAQLDRRSNRYASFVFILQGIVVFICGLLAAHANHDLVVKHSWYLQLKELRWPHFVFIVPARFFLLCSVMVPISFKVSVDVSKYYISQVINWDIHLYHEESDTPAIVNNTALAEDLGEIQFVLTDKTGTLTENRMHLKSFTCTNGDRFDATAEEKGSNTEVGGKEKSALSFLDFQRRVEEGKSLRSEAISDSNNGNLEMMITALVLCNTVERKTKVYLPKNLSTRSIDNLSSTFHHEADPSWCSPSPDEVAFVFGAQQCGVKLISRTRFSSTLDFCGTSKETKLLKVIPFSADRARQSVLVELKPSDDNYYLFMKGSDERMLPRCLPSPLWEEKTVQHQLYQYAVQGLRTLVFAYKTVPRKEAHEWLFSCSEASTIVDEVERGEATEAVYQQIENGLTYIGMTAVEDELQPDVKKTIESLNEANIRVWMLTGDKKETALQIAATCGMVRDIVFSFVTKDDQSVDEQKNYLQTEIEKVKGTLGSNLKKGVDFRSRKTVASFFTDEFLECGRTHCNVVVNDHSRHSLNSDDVNTEEKLLPTKDDDATHSKSNQSIYSIVIAGKALELIQHDQSLLEQFVPVLLHADLVICCRVTPSQKALIVKLVKSHGAMTLAIGDGGNDVAMIQEAHVGVGIVGEEGKQASKAADYAFAKFHYLSRLLFVHGHTSVQRTAFIVHYSFYKSMLIACAQLLANGYAAFTGISYWNSFGLAMWNGVHTFNLVFLYVLDIHVNANDLLKYPRLYQISQRARYFNPATFFLHLIRAILQCIAVFFVAVKITEIIGFSNGLGSPSTNMAFVPTYGAFLLLQPFTVLMEAHSINWIHWMSLCFTVISFFLVWSVYNFIKPLDFAGIFSFYLSEPVFYIFMLLLTVIAMLIHAAWGAFKFWIFSSSLQKYRKAKFLSVGRFKRVSEQDDGVHDMASLANSLNPRC